MPAFLALISLHFVRADLFAILAALLAILLISQFSNWTDHVEVRFINALSRMMNHRRWFTFWLVGFFIWAVARSMIIGFIDWDLIITTGFWSWWPFAVENIVKVTQGQTLLTIENIALTIKKQGDDAAVRDEETRLRDLVFEKALNANTVTLQRVLDAIEDRQGGEPASV